MAKTGKDKRKELCIFCNKRFSSKKGDHAVAKGLWHGPLPSDMVTVPACEQCNKEKGVLDENFRDVTATDIAASRNPIAQQLVAGKIARSVAESHSTFFKTAMHTARPVPLFTPGGLYVEDGVQLKIDDRKVRRLLKYMVRGLYYWVKDERIPDDYQYEVTRIRETGVGHMWTFLEERGGGAGFIGKDVFACRYEFGLEDRFVSYWLLVFYNAIAHGVMVVPRGGLDAAIVRLSVNPIASGDHTISA